jgi:hypothetical protein
MRERYMRETGQDEVFITTVVARVPAGQGRAELTHQLMAQAAMQSLAGGAGTAGYQPDVPRYERRPGYGGGRRPKADPARPVYLTLAALCLAGAGYTFYLALR